MQTRLFIFIILILVSLDSYAISQKDCYEYKLGNNFYCQKKKPKKKEHKVSDEKKEDEGSQEDYKEKMDEIKRTLEDKKIKAVIYPTEENLKDYMAYQQMILNKSSTFADTWRRVLWKEPSLDYTLKRPVNKIGKEAWIDKRNLDVVDSIRDLNEKYGIFFLFRSDCHFCHKYSPILKSFQNKHNLAIMPISMDGGVLPGWDNIVVNKGQIDKLGINVKSVPATMLFDKDTRKLIPLGFGVLSHTDLEERIFAITKLEVGNDF